MFVSILSNFQLISAFPTLYSQFIITEISTSSIFPVPFSLYRPKSFLYTVTQQQSIHISILSKINKIQSRGCKAILLFIFCRHFFQYFCFLAFYFFFVCEQNCVFLFICLKIKHFIEIFWLPKVDGVIFIFIQIPNVFSHIQQVINERGTFT